MIKNTRPKAHIELAPHAVIDAMGQLPSEFIQRIFDIGACLVTDESSLWDFQSEARGETKDDIVERIREVCRVSVADIKDGNLVAVLNRIRRCA